MIHAIKLLVKAGAEPTRVDTVRGSRAKAAAAVPRESLALPDSSAPLRLQFGNSALDSAIAQHQFGALALLRHLVSTQEWWANTAGGSSGAGTAAGGFGGIHALRQVLETGGESRWRGEESRGKARLV